MLVTMVSGMFSLLAHSPMPWSKTEFMLLKAVSKRRKTSLGEVPKQVPTAFQGGNLPSVLDWSEHGQS